jgi:hypothetical protein
MADVERACHVQITALDYDIPKSTLRSHMMELILSRKLGRKWILSLIEEEKVVKYINGMARYGHPINIIKLKIEVVEASQLRDTPFNDGNFTLYVTRIGCRKDKRIVFQTCFKFS